LDRATSQCNGFNVQRIEASGAEAIFSSGYDDDTVAQVRLKEYRSSRGISVEQPDRLELGGASIAPRLPLK